MIEVDGRVNEEHEEEEGDEPRFEAQGARW